MARAVQRTAARRDFINHYVYLAENAGVETAHRFRLAVESTYSDLAEMPGLGSPARFAKGNTGMFAYGGSELSKNISSLTGRTPAVLPSNGLFTRSRTISAY